MMSSIAARRYARSVLSSFNRNIRRVALALGGTVLGSLMLLPIAASAAGSSTVVISQIYGGGGNSGATYTNDFIELFNLGTTPVNLNGWSVQYSSATNTGTWSGVTALPNVTLQPGQYFLVQEASGGAVGSPLPTADVLTGAINLGASNGKVALVSSTTALSGACPTANIVDFVGFGTANCSEPTATPATANNAPAPSNTTADFRAGNGCTDTDNNKADFSTATPGPRNSSVTASACGSSGGAPTLSINSVSLPEGNAGTTQFIFTVTLSATPASTVTVNYATADGTATAGSDYVATSGTLTFAAGTTTLTQTIVVQVNGDTTAELDETFTVNLSGATNATIATGTGTGTIKNDDFGSYTIMQIQGHGAASPYAGQTVIAIAATGGLDVVTAVKSNGFFMQDSLGDGDLTTSDAVYVYTGSAPVVAVGDAVTVTATVAEFSGSTELTSPTVTVLGHGNALPTAYDISSSTNDPTSGVCTGSGSTINPLTDGYQASNFACLDGMLVTLPQAVVNAPTFGSGGSGIKADTVGGFYVRPASASRAFRKPGLMFPVALNAFPAGYDPSTYAGPVFNGEPEVVEVYLPGLLASTDIAALPNGGIYNSGAQLAVTGIVQGYQASSAKYPIYEIYPRPAAQTTAPDVVLNADAPTYPIAVPSSTPGTLTVGSQNMLHFFNNTADGMDTSVYNDTCAGTGSGDTCPTASQYAARMQKMSLQIRTVLKAPAIQIVQEAENYSVLQNLAAQMTTDDASVVYHPYLIPGNDPGGINIGVFARNDVTVNSVTQMYKGTITSACSSGSSCLLNDRPPVLVDATFNGSYHVRVLAIYNRSLLNLGTNDYVGKKRRAQAEQIACIVQALQTTSANVDCDASNPGADAGNAQQDASGNVTNGSFNVIGDATVPVVIVGDFNAYEFSDGYVDSTGTIMGTVDTDPTHSVYPPTASYVAPSPVLFDTGSAAAPANHYSYTFNGFAQEIDHILLTDAGKQDFVQIGNAYGNADVSSSSSDALITDTSAASANTARRSSDHDGQVVTLGYVVTPVVNGAGSISPATAQTVSSASPNPLVFTVTLGTSSQVSITDTCGVAGAAAGSFDSSTNTYTIPAGVKTNCSVTANFTYTVTTTLSGTGGTISAPAQSQVIGGQSTTFTVDSLTGYSIASVVGNTCTPSLQSGDAWTTGAITADCTITATFSPNPVNGACGSANGGTFTSLASDDPSLCSAGTLTNFTGNGPWSWTCHGANGGSDSATCTANTTPGSIGVLGGASSIGNGDNTPSTADGTDFGSVTVGSQLAHGFTISNAGALQPSSIGQSSLAGGSSRLLATGDLMIGSITSSNPAFTVSGGTGTIASGGSATFNVTFHATAPGIQNATITINSNDPTTPAYTFAVTALAVAAPQGATATAPALGLKSMLLLAAALGLLGQLVLRRRKSMK